MPTALKDPEPMRILRDLIESLPDLPVKKAVMGVFDTAVFTSRWGIASTIKPRSCMPRHAGVKGCGRLEEIPASELAGYSLSENPLEASLGMAAINSALHLDEGDFTEMNAAELLAKKGAGRDVAVVGNFPFLGKIRGVARSLSVVEQNPGPGDLPEGMAGEVLPAAEVVAITSTSLTNHTFESLMSCIKPSAFVMLMGPSTPLSAKLFDHGIHALSGTVVVDEDLMLSYLLQGASYRDLQGVRRVTMMKD